MESTPVPHKTEGSNPLDAKKKPIMAVNSEKSRNFAPRKEINKNKDK